MWELCSGLLEQNDVKQAGSGPGGTVPRSIARGNERERAAKYDCSGNEVRREMMRIGTAIFK